MLCFHTDSVGTHLCGQKQVNRHMFDLVCGAGYVVRRVIFKAVHFQGNEDNSSQHCPQSSVCICLHTYERGHTLGLLQCMHSTTEEMYFHHRLYTNSMDLCLVWSYRSDTSCHKHFTDIFRSSQLWQPLWLSTNYSTYFCSTHMNTRLSVLKIQCRI